jgi:hypothetical protein
MREGSRFIAVGLLEHWHGRRPPYRKMKMDKRRTAPGRRGLVTVDGGTVQKLSAFRNG